MLHPSLARALATAHIEDQLRAAARWRTIRLARRARASPGGDLESPYSDPRGLDHVDCARPAPRHDTHKRLPRRRRETANGGLPETKRRVSRR